MCSIFLQQLQHFWLFLKGASDIAGRPAFKILRVDISAPSAKLFSYIQ